MSIILNYHSIKDDVKHETIEVKPQTIIKHIGWLEKKGFKLVSVAELLLNSDKKNISITIDDGFYNFKNFVPYIKKNKIPVTIFICPSLLGMKNTWSSINPDEETLLSTKDILELNNNDLITFLPHGWNHVNFLSLDNDELYNSLTKCIEWFRKHMNTKPEIIAYPYGKINLNQIEIVAHFFKYGLSVEKNFIHSSVFDCPRITGVESMTLPWLIKQIETKQI